MENKPTRLDFEEVIQGSTAKYPYTSSDAFLLGLKTSIGNLNKQEKRILLKHLIDSLLSLEEGD